MTFAIDAEVGALDGAFRANPEEIVFHVRHALVKLASEIAVRSRQTQAEEIGRGGSPDRNNI